MRPPVLVIVGEVVSHAASDTWFTRRPLFGQRVLVTRPMEQASWLRSTLEQLGAEVLVQPAIEITPPDDWRSVDDALARLAQFDWLVFSSANGVRAVLDRILQTGGDMRRLAGIKLAAIGPGNGRGVGSVSLEGRPDAGGVSRRKPGGGPGRAGGWPTFSPGPRQPRPRGVGGDACKPPGRRSSRSWSIRAATSAEPDREIQAALAAGRIDWITVTSSAIARSLVQLFGQELKRAKLVSISPITSQALAELGFSPDREAKEYTMPGVVQALLAAVGKSD